MPPFDWSIKIEKQPDMPTQVVPNPLDGVRPHDTVSWGDRTGQRHHPWPTKENGDLLSQAEVTGANAGNYLSDEMPAGTGSRPVWVAVPSTITGNTIFYCCKLHPEERGKIVIDN
jgi:hypothetical protein